MLNVSNLQAIENGYYLLDISTSVEYQAAILALEQDPNIGTINPVGNDDGYNFLWSNSFYCRFVPGVSELTIDSLCLEYGLVQGSRDYLIERVYLFELTASSPLPLFKTSNAFSQMSLSEYAQPSFYHQYVPDEYSLEDIYFHTKQHHTSKVLRNSDSSYGAWEFTTGDSSIIVAVVDQTIEEHEDLTEGQMFWGYDLFNSNVDLYFPAEGILDAHGMHVAGVIGAKHNNIVDAYTPDGQYIGQTFGSSAGMAPDCKLMPIRMMKRQSLTEFEFVEDVEVARGICFAWKAGASVFNCSWTRLGSSHDLALHA